MINLLKIVSSFEQSDFPAIKDYRHAVDTLYYIMLLKACKGNLVRAAKVSRVGRPYLYKKLRDLKINPKWFRGILKEEPELPDYILDVVKFNVVNQRKEQVAEQKRKREIMLREKQSVIMDDLVKRGIINHGIPV